MSLAPGTRFGSYAVSAQIGVGGMGEVHRARDIKLNRDVALKVLPDSFISDPDRLARFQREAHVLASLNHPNIAAIYGIEDVGSVRALVMELVDGSTLAELIGGTGTPRALEIDDARRIAAQIAEALGAAHDQGVIHRDLKPANIKVKMDGTVKVLDFGLAKAVEPDPPSGLSQVQSLNREPLQRRERRRFVHDPLQELLDTDDRDRERTPSQREQKHPGWPLLALGGLPLERDEK